jgi:ribonuclease J
VDGLGVGDVSHVVLRDRQMMAADGMIVIIATIAGKTGKLTASPDIISRGFIYMRENKQLVEMIRTKIKGIINESEIKMEVNDEYVKEKLRNELGQFIYTKTQRRPMILPVLIAV